MQWIMAICKELQYQLKMWINLVHVNLAILVRDPSNFLGTWTKAKPYSSMIKYLLWDMKICTKI